MIENFFNTNILNYDLPTNYTFQKNYLGSLLKLKNKTIKELSDFLIGNSVKGGTSLINKINKGLLPKKLKTRKLISEFLEMEQKEIFINVEKLEESKTEYLAKQSKRIRRKKD